MSIHITVMSLNTEPIVRINKNDYRTNSENNGGGENRRRAIIVVNNKA